MKSFSFPRIETKSLPLQALSFVIALGLWAYVRNTVETAERQLFVVPSVVGLSDEFIVPDLESYRIPVLLGGPREIIQVLTPGSLTARLDFTGLAIREPGTYRVPVHLGDLPEGVSAVSVPRIFAVQLERVVHLTRRVEIAYPSKIPPDVKVLSASAEPPEVSVSGPASVVSRVHSVRIEVDPGALVEGSGRTFLVVAADAQNNPLKNLKIDPPSVRFLANIERIRTAKIVTVEPDIRGAPASGFAISAVRVEPPTITLEGDPSKMAPINAVPTTPIDITNHSRSIKFKDVPLLLPPSISSETSKVLVSIEIRPIKIRQVLKIPVSLHLPSGWTGSVVPPEVEVTVEGFSTALQRLAPGSITASVTIRDPQRGSSKHSPKVHAPDSVTVVSVNPAEVEVALSGDAAS